MSFAFPTVDPETSGAELTYDVPIGRYLGASFDEGKHFTVLNSLSRMREISTADADPTSPMLSPTEAQAKYGVGDLKFDEPVRESVAKIMSDRKKREMDRAFFLSHGSSAGRFLPGMAASILGGISNPLDLGLMLIPFVGEEAVAAKATSMAGRVLARRLVTREVLREIFPKAPALTESVINGVVGQSLFEIPNLIASKQDKADYGLDQALFNIATGGAFAASLHGAFHLLGKLNRGTREEMGRTALNQILRDESVKVDNFVKLDDAVIWRLVQFDEIKARQAAEGMVDPKVIEERVFKEYGVHAHPETPAALIAATGEVMVDSRHWTDAMIAFMDKHGEDNIMRGTHLIDGRVVPEAQTAAAFGVPVEDIHSEFLTMKSENGMTQAEDARFQLLQEEGKSRQDALDQVFKEREDRRKEIFFRDPDNLKRVEEYRQRAIESEIERMRAEHDPFQQFGEARRKEIERQIAEGKTLSPEVVQKSIPVDDSGTADVDKDIETLKKALKTTEDQAPGVRDQVIQKLDEWIKALSKPNNKLFTGVTGLEPIIAMVGKEVAKGLLIAVREGLKLTQDLTKAIDHAMEWLKKRGIEEKPELRGHLESAIIPESPDFTFTIQSELNKPQPFNVKPERFTPQVIMAKLKQLPAPEQAMLENAGIEEFFKRWKPTEVVPIDDFKKFVDSALPEVEIRPMLNVASENSKESIRQKLLPVIHEMETQGFKFDEDGMLFRNPQKMTNKHHELLDKYHELQDAFESGYEQASVQGDKLVGDFVSQNVSVPIPFEKMERPRTVFLAASGRTHLESSHYGDVFPKFGEKEHKDALKQTEKDASALAKQLVKAGYEENPITGAMIAPEGVNPENNPTYIKWLAINQKMMNAMIPRKKSMLAWAETHVVTLPDGRRVLHAFEAQSDVRQHFTVEKYDENRWSAFWIKSDGEVTQTRVDGKDTFPSQKEAQAHVDKMLDEFMRKNQPLIKHTDEILLKALVKMAKKEGLDGVVISDPRTAMLTQGHLGSMEQKSMGGWKDVAQWDESSRTWKPKEGFTQADMDAAKSRQMELTYEPPSQAEGMTQAYGKKLPDIMRKITGKEGEAVQVGSERHYQVSDEIEAGNAQAAQEMEGFNKAFPGSDYPTGKFFPTKELPNKPFEYFTPKMAEPPKPKLEAIDAAVECVLQKLI